MSGVLVPTAATTFGRMLKVPMPDDVDAMIVCVNSGGGLKPVRLLLRHQLYEETLREILQLNPEADEVTCVPIRPEYCRVWSRRSTAPDALNRGSR